MARTGQRQPDYPDEKSVPSSGHGHRSAAASRSGPRHGTAVPKGTWSTATGHGEQDDEEAEDMEGTPRRKRVKREPDAGAAATARQYEGEGEDELEEDSAEAEEAEDGTTVANGANGHVPHRTKTYFEERDAKGYVPGSVTRVACENFLTYDKVEFFPGPRLNMVIGPNGTGKSTIVCAIALGLGFPPALLGRANNLNQFVKHGAENAWCEVELKGRRGERNVVIRRTFSIHNNASKYILNGELSTATKVEAQVSGLNVQVNNLCSFLPQDKVTSFAQMGPIQLLRETQRAAGHPKLTEWHDLLIEEGRAKADVDTKLADYEGSIKDLQNKLDSMKRDVTRFTDRERIENRIKVLELALPFAQYSEAKQKFDEAKTDLREADVALKAAKLANEPVVAQRDLFAQLVSMLQNRKKALSDRSAALTNRAAKAITAIGKTEEAGEQLRDQLQQLKQDEKAHKAKVDKLKREVEQLQGVVAEPVEEPDKGPLQSELANLSSEARQKTANVRQLQSQQQSIANEISEIEREQASYKRQIEALQNVENRRMEALNTNNTSWLYRAVKIVREMRQQGRFRGTVYDPLRLVISPKEPRFAAAIEYALSAQTFNTFLCTNTEDYDLLMRELKDKERIRITAAVLPESTTLDAHRPPLSHDQIQELGFDGYLLDLVKAPEYVLTFLCQNHHLHQIPIAYEPNAPVNDAAFLHPRHPIRSWVIGDRRSHITFSGYGKREPTVKSFTFDVARVLTDGGVDQREIRELQQKIGLLNDEHNERQQALERLREEGEQADEAHEGVKQRITAVKQELDDLLRARADYTKALAKLGQKKRELEMQQNRPSTATQRARLMADVQQLSITRLDAVIEHKNIVSKMHHLNLEFANIKLKCAQTEMDHKAFKAAMEGSDENLEAAQAHYDQIEELKNRLKAEALQTLRDAQTGHASAPPHLRTELERLQTTGNMPSMQELGKELDEQNGKLGLIEEVDPATVQRYRRYQNQLADLNTSLEAHEKRRDHILQALKEIKEKYKPYLDELIASIDKKFDAAFKRMGCLGQVGTLEPEDYSKWGIEIRVSFRDDEPLKPLTAQRQSGGERSLATVTYLMSLTELAKAPFTLVDEINQGMDPRVERLMHDHLVEITCREDSAQAWLITPKLLTNLRYHKRMKVLCIANGEWIPERFDMKYWLKKNHR